MQIVDKFRIGYDSFSSSKRLIIIDLLLLNDDLSIGNDITQTFFRSMIQ